MKPVFLVNKEGDMLTYIFMSAIASIYFMGDKTQDDEFCCHTNENTKNYLEKTLVAIDQLPTFAGTTVIDKDVFLKAVENVHPEHLAEATELVNKALAPELN